MVELRFQYSSMLVNLELVSPRFYALNCRETLNTNTDCYVPKPKENNSKFMLRAAV